MVALIFLIAAIIGVGFGFIKPILTESKERSYRNNYDKTVAYMQDASGVDRTVVFANTKTSYSMPREWLALQALVQDTGLAEAKKVVLPNGASYTVTGFYKDQRAGYAETVYAATAGYGSDMRYAVEFEGNDTADESDDYYRVVLQEGAVSLD